MAAVTVSLEALAYILDLPESIKIRKIVTTAGGQALLFLEGTHPETGEPLEGRKELIYDRDEDTGAISLVAITAAE